MKDQLIWLVGEKIALKIISEIEAERGWAASTLKEKSKRGGSIKPFVSPFDWVKNVPEPDNSIWQAFWS